MVKPLHPIVNSLKAYFQNCQISSEKIALALSGGPDSMALYQMMVLLKKEFVVLHVNHNMRKESRGEAITLEKMCLNDQIPFHSFEIDGFDYNLGNIEDRLRKIRYAFFFDKLQQLEIKHLFLGHQKNDAEEVILKRILEGSSIFKIGAFSEQKKTGDITLHRPLLSYTKANLVAFLEENNLGYFIDETNSNCQFLRARMRQNIFPYLNEQFEKRIDGKFYQLGSELSEVTNYLKAKTQSYIDRVIQGKFGLYLPKFQLELLELKYILSHLLDQIGEAATKQEIDSLLKLYFQNVSNKRINLRKSVVAIDKTGFYFLLGKDPDFTLIEHSDAPIGTLDDLLIGNKVKIKKEDLPFFIKNKMKDSHSNGVSISFQSRQICALNG